MPAKERRWKYFTEAEMACTHCGACLMDEKFMKRLDALRSRCGFAFKITSGYRCAAHNQKVSSTGADGPHTTGKAADIAAQGVEVYVLLEGALAMGFCGIGISQRAGQPRFVHLDDIDEPAKRPRVWSY
jgi:zinc D-Ala-D-Ala carboxypeptidase